MPLALSTSAYFLTLYFETLTRFHLFLFLYLAVAGSALIGGRASGSVATAAGFFFATLLVVRSVGGIEQLSAIDALRLLGFVILGTLIATVSYSHAETTARLKVESVIRASASRALDEMITRSPVPVIAWDSTGNVTRWNPAAEGVFGWSAEEIIGTTWPRTSTRGADGDGRQGDRVSVDPASVVGRAKAGELIDLYAWTTSTGGRFSPYSRIAFLHDVSALKSQVATDLHGLFQASLEGLLITDRDLRIQSANPAASQILGFSAAELVGRPVASLVDPSSRRLLAGLENPLAWEARRHEARLIRKGGLSFSAEVSVVHFEVTTGTRQTAFFVRDIQERVEAEAHRAELLRLEQLGRLAAETAEKRAGYLARVTGELSHSLDPDETVRHIAELSVQGFATYCIVYIRAADGSVQQAALSSSEGGLSDVLEKLGSLPVPERSESVLTTTLETGQAMLLSGPEIRLADAFAVSSEHRELLLLLDLRSALLAPLRARGSIQGAIGFFNAGPDSRAFTEEDLRVAETLAQTGAFAIDNARLHAHAKQASLQREEVLAIVAHEVRSPLSAISIGSELMLNMDLDREMLNHNVEIIQHASSRISRQIHDLLDAARIDNSKLSIDARTQPLPPIIFNARSLIAARLDAKQVTLECEIEPNLTPVSVDRYRIEQVLCNLLENALEVVPAGGMINVSARRVAEEVEVCVSDTGPGIPAPAIEHVFDRFWQAKTTRRMGAGLGLAICKGIVEAHGGQIWVESVPGQGASFFFRIPISRPVRHSSNDFDTLLTPLAY